MVMKLVKPSPMSGAEPQNCMRLPILHLIAWLVAHGAEPPAQLVMPDLTSEAPISVSIIPTMSGGKSLRIVLGGMNAIAIEIKPQRQQVPKNAPTAFGHGSLTPLAPVGQ